MRRHPRFTRRGFVLLLVCVPTLLAAKCEIPKLITFDTGTHINQKIDSALKEFKDASETTLSGGWMSKLIRDVVAGDSVQRRVASANLARLIGRDAQSIVAGTAITATVRLDSFALDSTQVLTFDTRYLDPQDPTYDPVRADVDRLFNRPAGNGWNPQPVRSAAEYERVFARAEARVRALADSLVAPVVRTPDGMGGGFLEAPGTVAALPRDGRRLMGGGWFRTRAEADAHRDRQVAHLVDLVAAPYRTASLPAAGGWTGSTQIPWGVTQGTGRYLVLAIPQRQLRPHRHFTAWAWLHQANDPKQFLGVTAQILAKDFYQRCFAEPADPRFAPVSSNSSDGPLCWYIFDLFPSRMP